MQHLNHLSKSQQESVLSLIKVAHDFDGTPAIAEHVLLHLRHGGDKSDSHLVIEANKEIIAYAHLDTTDLVAGPSVEAVVHPQHRGKGLGALILIEAIKICGDRTRIWSHGDLPAAKSFTKLITSIGVDVPIMVITTEGGLSAINADWGIDDVILDTAGPAEVDARIRIVIGQTAIAQLASNPSSGEIKSGEVIIDESSYTAKIKGRILDLTFKEFELLKYLAQHPGRVFTRSQLLQEIWGYDYFGGTRTVDVHIRRLRSKLGPEFEAIIGTVRNVGYRFSVQNNQTTADIN